MKSIALLCLLGLGIVNAALGPYDPDPNDEIEGLLIYERTYNFLTDFRVNAISKFFYRTQESVIFHPLYLDKYTPW